MKTRTLLLSTLIAGTVGFSSIAVANSYEQQGHESSYGKQARGMHNKSPEQKIERMAQRLGLSATQKQQFSNLMQSKQANMAGLRSQIRKLRQSVRQLDPSTTNYTVQLTNLANQSANLARQMTLAKGQNQQQIFNLLTAEQRTKMRAMQENRHDKRAQRHQQ